MAFSDEKNEMTVSEIIRVTNNGNAPGKFKWIGEKGVFIIEPEEG